jgi:hypothetical protein
MRARIWMVVGVVAAAACGGGGSDGPPQQQTPPDTKEVYSDVFGIGVAPGAEEVAIGQWPSWLREKELVTACAAGEAFYADRCWQSVVIDVDARAVTFTHVSGQSERIAIGAPPPAILGPMVSGRDACSSTSIDDARGQNCLAPHHRNVGYVTMAELMSPQHGYVSGTVWDAPLTPLRMSEPPTRSPWAIASQLGTTNGVVSAFLVKTTFLYGFRATKPVPLFNDYQVVHNWPLKGRVHVNGQDLVLPLNLSALAGLPGAVVRGAYVDLGNHTVRFKSDRNVMQARSSYGGAGAGLTDPDLVTSIEFHAAPISELNGSL